MRFSTLFCLSGILALAARGTAKKGPDSWKHLPCGIYKAFHEYCDGPYGYPDLPTDIKEDFHPKSKDLTIGPCFDLSYYVWPKAYRNNIIFKMNVTDGSAAWGLRWYPTVDECKTSKDNSEMFPEVKWRSHDACVTKPFGAVAVRAIYAPDTTASQTPKPKAYPSGTAEN